MMASHGALCPLQAASEWALFQRFCAQQVALGGDAATHAERSSANWLDGAADWAAPRVLHALSAARSSCWLQLVVAAAVWEAVRPAGCCEQELRYV